MFGKSGLLSNMSVSLVTEETTTEASGIVWVAFGGGGKAFGEVGEEPISTVISISGWQFCKFFATVTPTAAPTSAALLAVSSLREE